VIVSINQPAYLPWLGYFHRIAVSDLHVVLDHVQFEKNSFTNRNKLRIGSTSAWLTVPLRTKGRFGDLAINEVEIADDGRWAAKHLATIRQGYARAPFFADHEASLESIYCRRWRRLIDLVDELTSYQLMSFGIDKATLRSSELAVGGHKEELVLNICRQVGATTYLSGSLGRQYLREEPFREAGIEVLYHEYAYPEYRQVHQGFVPHLAALDMLLNCGPGSLAVMCEGQEAIA
jgi:hypothetical protein